MERAYDAVFRTEVDAGVISKLNSADYGERYRFKCLWCGEEVFLAAAESKEKSPHLEHCK